MQWGMLYSQVTEISNKPVVIIEGDLNATIQLMNMVELDEGVKILSDNAAALVNEALMEKPHQAEKQGQFFDPSLKQDVQPEKSCYSPHYH